MNTITYCWLTLKSIFFSFANTSLGGWILTFILQLFMLFLPVYNSIIAIFVLTLLDSILGVIAAIKRGDMFKSRKFRKGIIDKMILYGILMIVFIILERALMSIWNYGTFFVLQFVTILIALYEGTSILEKLSQISPQNQVVVRLLAFLGKLKDKAEEKVEKQIDDL